MAPFSNYKAIVASLSILSGFLSLACLWVGAMAVEYNLDAFSEPGLTLNYSQNYDLAKWFNLLDLFGYYLLLLPLVFYFHQQYKFRSPWISLITFCGCSYVLMGSLGASILAVVWPGLMKEYIVSTPENMNLIALLFETITQMVTKGVWNILEVIFASVWWLGIGKYLLREQKVISYLTLITGIASLMDALGTMFGLYSISEIGMNSYLLLGIIWPITLGIWILRKAFPINHVQEKLQEQHLFHTESYEHF